MDHNFKNAQSACTRCHCLRGSDVASLPCGPVTIGPDLTLEAFTTPADVKPPKQHSFNGEGRCWDCDCRPWGVWASLPCGTDTIPDALTWDEFTARATMYATITATN